MDRIDVVAAVIRDADEYLACRRTPQRGGLWEFPGGKVQHGETHAEALRREIEEELGVQILVGEQLGVSTDPEIGIRLFTFAATLQAGRPTTSTDHDVLQWVGPSELDQLSWSMADRDTVALLVGNERR